MEVTLGQLYDQYKKDEPVVLPAGTRVQLEVAAASVKGENAIFPVFRVTSGPNAGSKVLAGQLTLTEKSASIFYRQLAGFGIGEDFIKSVAHLPLKEALAQIANALTGRVVETELQTDKWQGQDRNKLPIGGIKLIRANGQGVGNAALQPVPTPQPVAAPVAAPAPQAPVPPVQEQQPVLGQTQVESAPVALAPAEQPPAPAPVAAPPQLPIPPSTGQRPF